jgi:hypothetical protein
MSLDDFSTIELLNEVQRRRRNEVPNHICSKCGILYSESVYGSLVDIRVMVRKGEEGHADIYMLLCDECLDPVLDGLRKLGFEDHRHGGINFLEAECVDNAYENCPTPSEYGMYVVEPGGGRNYERLGYF